MSVKLGGKKEYKLEQDDGVLQDDCLWDQWSDDKLSDVFNHTKRRFSNILRVDLVIAT